MNKKLGSYQSAETIGKSQIDLILKVYDGAVGSLESARQAYTDERLTDGREQMERARRFVTHLYTTLNMEMGGEVAENLGKLYAYVISQSYAVQATKDLASIADMISILDNLRAGWRGLRQQQAENRGNPGEENREPAEAGVTEFVTTA
jgi:flagellar secretion chaperone FliS